MKFAKPRLKSRKKTITAPFLHVPLSLATGGLNRPVVAAFAIPAYLVLGDVAERVFGGTLGRALVEWFRRMSWP